MPLSLGIITSSRIKSISSLTAASPASPSLACEISKPSYCKTSVNRLVNSVSSSIKRICAIAASCIALLPSVYREKSAVVSEQSALYDSLRSLYVT
ncbi:Uncharacterised protein [Vibrio cholerae]|nr:Uncharacterised protein [Vibrio cholerae]CSB43313.1 Uncharacterised protein [Vibrio cholerae]CSC03922.1 Uncharacterised protein [Vibrio cholerae]CSC74304.1 Uncharacterised protein [Vibrio cholerae]CSH93103.1 Uncharacterised protein [Vibrio cholerae]